MDFENVWVLEYSPMQGCFHVDLLSKSIKNNIAQSIGARAFTGYLTVFAGTRDQCYYQCSRLKDSSLSFVGR